MARQLLLNQPAGNPVQDEVVSEIKAHMLYTQGCQLPASMANRTLG